MRKHIIDFVAAAQLATFEVDIPKGTQVIFNLPKDKQQLLGHTKAVTGIGLINRGMQISTTSCTRGRL